MTRKVILGDDGSPVTLPNQEDIENLKLGTLRKVYFAGKPDDIYSKDRKHLIYKLHRIGLHFMWLAMWNGEGYISVKTNNSRHYAGHTYKSEWDTIEEAVASALNSGYKVIRADENTINSIKYSMET